MRARAAFFGLAVALFGGGPACGNTSSVPVANVGAKGSDNGASTNLAAPVAPGAADANVLHEAPTTSLATRLDAGPRGAEQTAALALVHDWLAAMRAKDNAAIGQLVHYPFAFRFTMDTGACASFTAKSERELGRLVVCLGEALLAGDVASLRDDDLRESRAGRVVVEPAYELPEWGRRWRKQAEPKTIPVEMDIRGNGIDHRFVLFVRDGRVTEVWRDQVFKDVSDFAATLPAKSATPPSADTSLPLVDAQASEAGTARSASPLDVAQRWLAAVRVGDIDTIRRMVRYPFAFRDAGKEVYCSKSLATSESELEPLLPCITDAGIQAELQVPNAAHLRLVKELPKWGRRWQRTLPADVTPALLDINGNGIDYHFVLFVHDDGIAAIWNNTYFERD